jgi:hypothetical protein
MKSLFDFLVVVNFCCVVALKGEWHTSGVELKHATGNSILSSANFNEIWHGWIREYVDNTHCKTSP